MSMSQPEYDIIVMEDVMVPARDGVGLAADIYRPGRDGDFVREPLPVILERTPYNKRNLQRIERNWRYFARRGYIFVAQDCRGCYKSEGEMSPFWQEGPDGYDTVEWLAQQPWCNGRIGTTGTSYMAWTQNSLAVQNPPHLTCMWVNQGPSNAYTSSLRHGGALELRIFSWLYVHAVVNSNAGLKADPAVQKALDSADVRAILRNLPIKEGETALAAAPGYERAALNMLTRADYDDLWKDPSVNYELHRDRFADVPTVFCSAWYDSYTRATIENYLGISKRNRGPYRLIMGGWVHGEYTMQETSAGGIDQGPESPIDYNVERLRWFDHWLKGQDTGVESDPPVRYFVMGGGDGRKNREGRLNHGGRWRTESQWPPAGTRFVDYYLHGDGSMSPEAPSDGGGSTTYTFDPRDPVPTIGGNISALTALRDIPKDVANPETLPQDIRGESIVVGGGWDQRERPDIFGARPPYTMTLSSRRDVLVFQTEPLDRDVEVIGPLEVKLWAGSDASDTDFTAKLIDVYPPSADYPTGFALNISDSIMRMRYRNSWENPEPMVPGEAYEVTITLYPTANLFARGHRIRLDISSSNFPRFDVNPNTGEPIGRNTQTRVANNTVHHGATRPSRLVLPLAG